MMNDGSIFAYSVDAVREQMAQFVTQQSLSFNHFDNRRLTPLIYKLFNLVIHTRSQIYFHWHRSGYALFLVVLCGQDGNNVNTNGAPTGNFVISPALKPQVFVGSSKANDFVAFYKSAFGAEEVNCIHHPMQKANRELLLLLSTVTMLGSTWYYIYDFRRSP
ncbi:hypothetical protein R6Q59_023285 [Mikania micrantha]